jgi:hypothetical protein
MSFDTPNPPIVQFMETKPFIGLFTALMGQLTFNYLIQKIFGKTSILKKLFKISSSLGIKYISTLQQINSRAKIDQLDARVKALESSSIQKQKN